MGYIIMTTPVCTYDFTLKAENIDHNDVITMLKDFCKKYTFQKEQGEQTGYIHYQGRFSLKEKLRKNKILENINLKYEKLNKISLSPTSSQNQGNTFYVTKNETRIDGPWTDKDTEIYIPRQIRGITLRAWQQYVVDDASNWDTRTINWIYDPDGNHGKSTLKTYIGVHKIGRSIPFSNDYRDIMRMVMATDPCRLYIIDLPRALQKDHLYQFTSGTETLKDGYAFDDRYSFKERYFDCPNIWIFANKKPDLNLLTNGRWVIWEFEGENLRRAKAL